MIYKNKNIKVEVNDTLVTITKDGELMRQKPFQITMKPTNIIKKFVNK